MKRKTVATRGVCFVDIPVAFAATTATGMGNVRHVSRCCATVLNFLQSLINDHEQEIADAQVCPPEIS